MEESLKKVRVAAAVVRREGKFLVCKRGAGGSCAHLYEFPGGKIEPGETPRACAEREGVSRAVCDYVAGMTDNYAVRRFEELFIPVHQVLL